MQYLNHQVLLGESSEIDLAGYATIASTMLRIGTRLGVHRRARDVTPTLSDFLTAPPLAVEPTTGEAHLRHHISPSGYYRGKKVVKSKGE